MAARRKRAFSMDCRVKPGNDEQRVARRLSAVMAGLVPAPRLWFNLSLVDRRRYYLLRFTRAVCRAAALRCVPTGLRLPIFLRDAAIFFLAAVGFLLAAL